MPTDAEIFAGSSKDFHFDNLIQVAKTHRNVDLVKLFNAGRTTNKIQPTTVGARISRAIDFIAERDGHDRKELYEEFWAERRRNGVAGRNQYTNPKRNSEQANGGADEDEDTRSARGGPPSPEVHKVTPPKVKKPKQVHGGRDDAGSRSAASQRIRRQKPKVPPKYTEETEDSDRATESPEVSGGKMVKQATPQMVSGHREQRRDSKAASSASASPLLGKGKRKTVAARLVSSAAGTKRDHSEDGEVGDADSQQDSRPQKSARTESSSSASSSTSPKGSKTPGRRASSSQGGKELGAAGDDSPSSNSSSGLGERSPTPSPPSKVSDEEESEAGSPAPEAQEHNIFQQLDDAEAYGLLSDFSPLNDDYIIRLAIRSTIPEMAQSANRAAPRQRYQAAHVIARLNSALEGFAQRRETSVTFQYNELNARRAENGIEAIPVPKEKPMQMRASGASAMNR